MICFFAGFGLICPALADDLVSGEIPFNQYGIRSLNPYVVDRLIIDGKTIDKVIVPSRPDPPVGYNRQVAVVYEADMADGIRIIPHMPALRWSFGCSATSAAMMFGHYDNTGYGNMYTGPANGGVFPMTNEVWGYVTINGEYRAQCPLSATREGVDGRIGKGHVDDYWIASGSTEPDPFIDNWDEHVHGECTADYMGTSQSLLGDPGHWDGTTTFYYDTNGYPLVDYTGAEPADRDGCHGLRLFAESRGYRVDTNFSQYIAGYQGNANGFTLEEYKNEIDAGRPVMIHVEGHSMLGYGYDEAGSTIYIHDAWDYDVHTMTWGGFYTGMTHYAVTVLRLVGRRPLPFIPLLLLQD